MERMGQEQPQERVPAGAQDAMRLRIGVQKALMMQVGVEEWFKEGLDGSDSLAARFSDYFDEVLHGQEPANLNNPDVVQKIVEEIKKYKKGSESLH